MVRFLAGVGVILGSQALWLAYMMGSAKLDSDPTCGGAYCAVWMLGIPIVFGASLLVAALIAKGK